MNIFPPDPVTIKVILWLVRILRRLPALGQLMRNAKNRYLLGSFYDYHMRVVHRWRDVFVASHDWADIDSCPAFFKELCNGCRDCVAEILDVPLERIHCTIKMFRPGNNGDARANVVTLGRSEPCERPPEYGFRGVHFAEKNTVFAAICGLNDGHNVWKPNSCFSCNDLTKRINRFACDRANWSHWYKSTVAVPIRFRDPRHAHDYKILGFLTLDMPTVGEFTAMPDIFEYDWQRYQELLIEFRKSNVRKTPIYGA